MPRLEIRMMTSAGWNPCSEFHHCEDSVFFNRVKTFKCPSIWSIVCQALSSVCFNRICSTFFLLFFDIVKGFVWINCSWQWPCCLFPKVSRCHYCYCWILRVMLWFFRIFYHGGGFISDDNTGFLYAEQWIVVNRMLYVLLSIYRVLLKLFSKHFIFHLFT